MQSSMWKLEGNDYVKGLFTALFTAVVVALAGIVQTPGFDVFNADWHTIGANMFNIAIVTFIGYLSKNLMTDKEGKLFGKI